MPPIPIAMCGKSPSHAATFAQLMLPEYEVIHHFQSTAEATSTLPAVMRGERVAAASGVGTSSGAIPRAIFVGGGFAQAELDDMLLLPDATAVPWVAADADPEKKERVRALGLEAAMAGIVERAKAALGEVVAPGVEGRGGEVVRY